jgi:hypothetical protein
MMNACSLSTIFVISIVLLAHQSTLACNRVFTIAERFDHCLKMDRRVPELTTRFQVKYDNSLYE